MENYILQSPVSMIRRICKFLPFRDLITFLSTLNNEVIASLQIYIQNRLTHVDLRDCFDLDVEFLLTGASLTRCIGLNLNHCYWLTPNTILRLLGRERNVLTQLHIVECKVTPAIITRVANLSLSSLSISWTNDWFNYLKRRINNRIKCFQNLKELEIFYPRQLLFGRPQINPFNLCQLVLQHCTLLETLKLHEYPHFKFCAHTNSEHRRGALVRLPNATPLPNLKSISIDFIHCQNIIKRIAELLNAILPEENDRPLENDRLLENVNLGTLSIPLLEEQSLVRKWWLLQGSSTFCLGAARRSQTIRFLNEQHWSRNEHVQSMLTHFRHEHVIMRNLEFVDFQNIALTILANSGNTIQRMDLGGCVASESLFQGLLFILYCKQLTFLDITFIEFEEFSSTNNSNFILDAIGNLRNLKQLYLTPLQIGVKVDYTNNLNDLISKPPPTCNFYKVTSQCTRLDQIRIVNHQKHISCVVFEETLACIASCKNLTEFHLVNFYTHGHQAALPQIAADCTKLETIYIANIENTVEEVNILAMEQFLNNTKSIKQLSLVQNFTMTRTFIDALCNCKNLERISFESIVFEKHISRYLGENLHNLTKLWSLRIHDNCYFSTGTVTELYDTLQERKQTNPAFAFDFYYYSAPSLKQFIRGVHKYSPAYFNDTRPIAHFHLQQYSLASYCFRPF